MKYCSLVLSAILLCAWISSCKKNEAPADPLPTSSIDSGKLYTHLLSGARHYTGTRHENWPMVDTTYLIDTTISFTYINDSTLSLGSDMLQHIHSGYPSDFYVTRGIGGHDYTTISYYYKNDSVVYVYHYSPGLTYSGTTIHISSKQ